MDELTRLITDFTLNRISFAEFYSKIQIKKGDDEKVD